MPDPFVPCTAYVDKVVRLDDGKPAVMAGHQRQILDHTLTPRDGHLPHQTVLWSEPKKSGKTETAAWVASWVLNTHGPRAEVGVVGNDLEQSCERVFARLVRIQEAHPTLKRRIVRSTDKLLVLDDGSMVKAISLDAAGEAGANYNLVIHDEAWGITSEASRRLFDELTPVPTRPLALRGIWSYAGFPGESITLEKFYKRGLAGTPIPGLPDCTAAGSLFMYWSHTPRMPWQLGEPGRRYYAAQREDLRPNAFMRLHENVWVASESSFVTPAQWDACVDPTLVPPRPDFAVELHGGLDAAPKHDSSALVTVYWDRDGRLGLGPVRLWKASLLRPMDFDALADAVRDLHRGYSLRRVLCDPFQMAAVMQSLRREGVGIEEYPQTSPNLTKATEALFDAVRTLRLRLYPHPDLREHVTMNAVAVESSRGLRLEKVKGNRKIDLAVALSMAVVAAMEASTRSGVHTPVHAGKQIPSPKHDPMAPTPILSWDEKSAAHWDGIARGPGGAGRRGLII